MKKRITILVALIASFTIATGQSIPNYLPTNGLVGWWPFNGNANDESGNNNIGTVNGAALIADRFGNQNKAYDFDGLNDYISISPSTNLNFTNEISISLWFKKDLTENAGLLFDRDICGVASDWSLGYENGGCWARFASPSSDYLLIANLEQPNNWHNIVFVRTNNEFKIYLNGVLSNTLIINSNPFSNNNLNIFIGEQVCNPSDVNSPNFMGIIDDIGIWNRSLNQQEITDLFSSINCTNDLTINPSNNQLQTNSSATFTAITSDPNPSYVWQSNLGQGYQTLNDVENYSGTNTSTLNISNIQLANHNQPIRVITTSGECVDTSNIATISILDTCITSINDTTFITVTDTLVINTLITGINPPNNSNTIKVYPNPANSHITIEYGDFAIMNGYQMRIENSLGQEVFQTNISQQSDYLNLNSWGGNGLYFVHIVDPQGNTIDIRKIVLQ